jgi:hypothetical protein
LFVTPVVPADVVTRLTGRNVTDCAGEKVAVRAADDPLVAAAAAVPVDTLPLLLGVPLVVVAIVARCAKVPTFEGRGGGIDGGDDVDDNHEAMPPPLLPLLPLL